MEKKLKRYGGQGYDFSEEIGVYEVKTSRETKRFTKLSEARKYFDSLNEAKYIWDVYYVPELLDGYFELQR